MRKGSWSVARSSALRDLPTRRATYTPSLPMVREMARASLGEPSREALARLVCRARGLIDRRGRLTKAGQGVLQRESAKFGRWEARHAHG